VSALPELPEVHHPERGLKKDDFDTRDSRTLILAETTFYDQGKLDYDIVKVGLSVLYEPKSSRPWARHSSSVCAYEADLHNHK
jgi:hypothetical protein